MSRCRRAPISTTPHANALQLVAGSDLRRVTGYQDFVDEARTRPRLCRRPQPHEAGAGRKPRELCVRRRRRDRAKRLSVRRLQRALPPSSAPGSIATRSPGALGLGHDQQVLLSQTVGFPKLPQHAAEAAIVLIKALHTAVFLFASGCILYALCCGIVGRASHRAAAHRDRGTDRSSACSGGSTAANACCRASSIACPPAIARQPDIFLPDWVASWIMPVSTSLLVAAVSGALGQTGGDRERCDPQPIAHRERGSISRATQHASRTRALHRIARRFARHAVERVEQPFAPGMDRIVLGQQLERADHARPLERRRTRCSRHSSALRRREKAASAASAASAPAPCENPRRPCRGRRRLPPAACRSAPRGSCGNSRHPPASRCAGISATISGNMPPTTVTSPHQFIIRPMARPPSPPNSDGRSG